MYKFGVDLPDEHWNHAESIIDSSASEKGKKDAIEDWLDITAQLLLAKNDFVERSSEALVKAFGRIILYQAKRPDLLRLSYVRSKLKRGSNGTILKWIDDLKRESVESMASSHLLAAVPEEIQDIAVEMITKLWKAARVERERPTLSAERVQLESLQEQLKSSARQLASSQKQNELANAELDSLKNRLRSCEIELQVAREQIDMHREETENQSLRFNDTLEQLRRSIDLAQEQRRNALLEIDRAKNMTRPLEDENKRLRKQLGDESVMTEQYRAKATALELKVGELQLLLSNKK